MTSPTLFIYACFCRTLAGQVIESDADIAVVVCWGCERKIIATAFVRVGSLVSMQNGHKGHSPYRVTNFLNKNYPHDYHVGAKCLECGAEAWTIGPHDTSPSWYNWVAHNRLYLPFPERS